jgi:hypothetical protein
VTASLIGPDGNPRQTETGVRDPGTYRIGWSGRTPGGGFEPEGRWRWVVNALDDQGQHSKVERRFYLNRTLGYLRVRPTRVVVRRRGGKLRVGFRLAHPAVVTVTIRNARGGGSDDSAPPGSSRHTINGPTLSNSVNAYAGSCVEACGRRTRSARPPERRFLVRRARH